MHHSPMIGENSTLIFVESKNQELDSENTELNVLDGSSKIETKQLALHSWKHQNIE